MEAEPWGALVTVDQRLRSLHRYLAVATRDGDLQEIGRIRSDIIGMNALRDRLLGELATGLGALEMRHYPAKV